MYDNLWGCYILFQQKYNKKISQRIHLYSICPILPQQMYVIVLPYSVVNKLKSFQMYWYDIDTW